MDWRQGAALPESISHQSRVFWPGIWTRLYILVMQGFGELYKGHAILAVPYLQCAPEGPLSGITALLQFNKTQKDCTNKQRKSPLSPKENHFIVMVSFCSGGQRWAALLLFLASVALCNVRAGLIQLPRESRLSSGSSPRDGRGNFISEGQGLVEKCRAHYRSQVAVITEPTWKSHTTPSALPSSLSAHINTDTGNQEEVWKLEITHFSL